MWMLGKLGEYEAYAWNGMRTVKHEWGVIGIVIGVVNKCTYWCIILCIVTRNGQR